MHARLGVALAVALAACAVVPATAPAATVFTRLFDDAEPLLGTVYEAAPGEANRLDARDAAGAALQARLVESGAPLTVLPECVAPDPGAPIALCPLGPALIDLGDRDDVAAITANFQPTLSLLAGDGDDDVFAESAQPVVQGGAGDDRIRLGERIVVGAAHGGPGRDVLLGGPYANVLSGGTGDDLVLNQGTIGNVTVEGNEGDDVVRLRDVTPGSGNTATGGSGSDLLFVAPPELPVGPDPGFGLRSWFLGGDDGRDVLVGGANPDGFDAGPGGDLLVTRDGNAELVECGAGFDVAFADPDDAVTGCELVLGLRAERADRLRLALDRVVGAFAARRGGVPPGARHALRGLAGGLR